MLRSSRKEFVVEGYQVGMWMKRTSERLVREKKEQEEKKREKERRCREENERKDKEIRRKQMEAKKRRQDRFEKNFEEFSKELKNIVREYLGEKKSVEKESFDFEDKIQEREVEKEKQENEVKVVEEVILETGFYPNLLPSSVDSIMQEVEDEIPKEQCNASIEVKLQEEFGDVSPKEVPCNFVPNMRLRHQVDIIPSAPLLTRPPFQIHEEVPPKEIEDEVRNDSSSTVGNPWPITTLTPSSKFSCGFICWDSPISIPLSNNSFISLEEKEVNEAECFQGVDTICDLWKNDYVLESQEKEDQANSSIDLAKFSNVEVTCDAFFRFIFDPGGIRARNSWSNSLEEGGNDVKLG